MKNSKTYYNDVKKMFYLHGKKEKQFLLDFKEQLTEYESDHPHVDYQTLEEVFGTPINVFISYCDSVDSQYMLKRMNMKKLATITCGIIVSLALIVSLIFSFIIWEAREEYKNTDNYWEETIEEMN